MPNRPKRPKVSKKAICRSSAADPFDGLNAVDFSQGPARPDPAFDDFTAPARIPTFAVIVPVLKRSSALLDNGKILFGEYEITASPAPFENRDQALEYLSLVARSNIGSWILCKHHDREWARARWTRNPETAVLTYIREEIDRHGRITTAESVQLPDQDDIGF